MSDLDDKDFEIRAPYVQKILELQSALASQAEQVRKLEAEVAQLSKICRNRADLMEEDAQQLAQAKETIAALEMQVSPELIDAYQDNVRVLRIIEYVGRRDVIERQVANSIQGTKRVNSSLVIRVATIGTYPEILACVPEKAGPVSGD